jgi:hypothetical protein
MSTTDHSLDLVREYPTRIEFKRGQKDVSWDISMRCKDGDEMVLISRIQECDDELMTRFKAKENGKP